MSEREIGADQARAQLGALIDDAAIDGTITYLTRRGRRYAAIVPLSRISEAPGGSDACAPNVPSAER